MFFSSFGYPRGEDGKAFGAKGSFGLCPLFTHPPSMHYYLQVRLTTSNEYLSNACMHAPCAEISTWAGWLSDKIWEFLFPFFRGGFLFLQTEIGK